MKKSVKNDYKDQWNAIAMLYLSKNKDGDKKSNN